VRLTFKLGLAILPGALVVVAAAAYLELRQDRADFDTDQRSDDRAMARLLADAVGRIWDARGRDTALSLLADRKALGTGYSVRWLEPAKDTASLPSSVPVAAIGGGDVAWRAPKTSDEGWLHTLAPVTGGADRGNIDLSEAPPDLRPHLRRTIRSTALTTLGLGGIMMLITLIVGAWMVGRPISALIDQTRRVGEGDLRARSLPQQRDELGDLARALNGMLDRLEVAAREIQASTQQRFAALEQLRHADRLTTVGRLASSVAHEMGTPLNVVTGRARLIVEDEREAVEHARIIIDQAERMTKIIRQLLDYARRRPPQKQPCDLAQLTREMLPMLDTLARKRHLELRFSSEVPHASIVADPAQVQQALTNLVLNAIQASVERGSVDVILREARSTRKSVAGEPQQPRDTFAVCVQDHGAGMPSDVLERVFEPFFTTKPVGESTGLGLSVANDIVDDHGGWITAESEPGRGSQFTLHLPREQV